MPFAHDRPSLLRASHEPVQSGVQFFNHWIVSKDGLDSGTGRTLDGFLLLYKTQCEMKSPGAWVL